MPCSSSARAHPAQSPPSIGSLHDAHDNVPQTLSPWPCSSCQLAPCSRRNRVNPTLPRKTARLSADAFQSPPRTATGQPSLTMSLAPSSPPSAAKSGSNRSRASGREPGRSGRLKRMRWASASSPRAQAAMNCSSSVIGFAPPFSRRSSATSPSPSCNARL